jgi:hypothetical protein
MADFDAQQPVRAIATQFTTEVANATGTTINPAEEFAQGSTTSGQSGPLMQAAVTTGVPTYTTGTTNPLSMDINGNLRVAIDASASEQSVNLNQVGGAAYSLGQKTMANSMPITIASDQSALPVTQSTSPWVDNITQWDSVALGAPSAYGTSPGAVTVIGVNAFITNVPAVSQSGAWNITNITGTISLPTGASTSALQTSGNASLTTIATNTTPLAQGSTTTGQSGDLSMGAVTTAPPTYTTGTTQPLSLDTSGNLRVTIDSSVSEQNVNLNQVGGVAYSLGQKTMANSMPVVLSSDQSAIPVTQSTTPWVTNVTQWDSTVLGAPSAYGTSPGAVTVIGVNAFITNTPTVTANQGGTWNINNITGTISLPTGAATSALQTTGNTSLATIATTLTLAQGSTTSGQTGSLQFGAVTTAAPTYTTGQSSPLSLDTAGNLRTTTIVSTPAATLTYFTDASVATNATVTHSVAGPVNLDAIHGSGSGEIKMTIAIGITGSEVTLWNGFTSASNQDCEFTLKNTYVIPAGSSAKVTLKNRDTAAQDLYLTFVTH